MLLKLNFHCAEEVPRYLYTDEIKLRQVLINLISNALKFTHKGQIKLIVCLPAKREVNKEKQGETAHLIFEVKDTGEGIQQEELNQLFDKVNQHFSSNY